MTRNAYIPGFFPLALLAAEFAVAFFIYTAMNQALDRNDAILFLLVVPFVALTICAVLLLLAVSHSLKSMSLGCERPFNAAWTTGSAVGLVGLLLAVGTGPHAAAFFIVWFLAAQAVIYAIAHVVRLRMCPARNAHPDESVYRCARAFGRRH